MGYYINPPDQSKEDWLVTNGKWHQARPLSHYNEKDDSFVVCLVANPGFTAAAVCYTQNELEAFSHPHDNRGKAWISVPISKLIEVGAIDNDHPAILNSRAA